MIGVLNSVTQCAARLCRTHPEALQSQARLIGEYVEAGAQRRSRQHAYYVTIITGRATTPDHGVLNSGDVVVSPAFPKLRGQYCAYYFEGGPRVTRH